MCYPVILHMTDTAKELSCDKLTEFLNKIVFNAKEAVVSWHTYLLIFAISKVKYVIKCHRKKCAKCDLIARQRLYIPFARYFKDDPFNVFQCVRVLCFAYSTYERIFPSNLHTVYAYQSKSNSFFSFLFDKISQGCLPFDMNVYFTILFFS